MRRSVQRLAVFAAAMLIVAAVADAQVWWQNGWPHRRAVTVANHQQTNLPGDDIAVVTMPTGGLIKPDGSDLRVATAAGDPVACQVLMVGPGDQASLAFALEGLAERYYVYFGNAQPPPGKALEIRRGVLLEMRAYTGGGFASLEQIQKVFERSQELVGKGMVDSVFLGLNPFGPQNRLACRFEGYFTVQTPGSYEFACTSRHDNYMLVDDKLVYQYLGRELDRTPTAQQKVELKGGLHKLTIYHVNSQGDPIVVAAWRGPGEKNLKPIPAQAFAPVLRAAPGPMEDYGKALTIDFLPQHDGEAFVIDRYYQRYGFTALQAPKIPDKVVWQWDFGDGQSAVGADVQHIYLVPGQYAVTLKAKTSAGELTRTHRVFVSRPWDRVAMQKLDAVGGYGRIVQGYDFARLDAEGNAEAAVLLDRAGLREGMLKAGAAFIARDSAPQEKVQQVAVLCAEQLTAMGQHETAVRSLTKGAKMTNNPTVCATLLVQAGRIVLDRLDDPDRAWEMFDSTLKKYSTLTTAAAIQDARIGLGDVWRARGDYDKALKQYTDATRRGEATVERLIVIKGDLARHVEEYVRTKDFQVAGEYLDRWQRQFPIDKLEGYWSLLRAQVLAGQGRHEEAAREAEALVKVAPGSNYAPALLMLAAESYDKLKRSEDAKAARKRIAEKYPESPLAREASRQAGL